MKAKRWLSAVLLLAVMAGAASPVQAAASQKQESGRSQEGVEYTLSYPEIRGTITAEFTSLNEGWEGDGQPHTRTVKLPVVASGDPFVLRFKSGLTSARCSDCAAGENPLCTPVVFGVGAYTLTERGYFEWRGYAGARFAQQANTLELDCEADRVGMMAIEKLSIDPDPHMSYAPGNSTKTLSIPVTYLAQYDEDITDKQLAAGWQERENVESSRIILAQAETPEEAQELTEFFRAAHDYGEMTLSDEPDENGVTMLAKPMSRVSRGEYLDQKLSANKAVLQANQAGVVDGVGQGKFAPRETTNREQVATMLYRAVTVLEKETEKDLTPAAGSVEKFSDRGRVSAWALEGMGVLAANGIMKGTSETQLSPAETCTVEQGVLLCFRLYQKLAD